MYILEVPRSKTELYFAWAPNKSFHKSKPIYNLIYQPPPANQPTLPFTSHPQPCHLQAFQPTNQPSSQPTNQQTSQPISVLESVSYSRLVKTTGVRLEPDRLQKAGVVDIYRRAQIMVEMYTFDRQMTTSCILLRNGGSVILTGPAEL